MAQIGMNHVMSTTNIMDTNLQHQLGCENAQIEIDLQKKSERVEKQI